MPARWSKLQKLIEGLFDPKINLRLHMTPYRMKSQMGSTDLPRYWLALNKEIVFDYPGNIKAKGYYPYQVNDISDISHTLRTYYDCPKDQLLTAPIHDEFGILNILRAADRRLGQTALQMWSKDKPPEVQKILNERFGGPDEAA